MGALARGPLIRILQVLIVVVAIVGWHQLGTANQANELTISTPGAVLAWMRDWVTGETGHGLNDLLATLRVALLGWILGVVSSITIASMIHAGGAAVRSYAAPFVSAANAVPKIALAPLAILIFGSNATSKVLFVTSIVFFITFFNVYGGLQSIEPRYLQNAKVLGANRLWQIREIYGPSVVGWVMTSLRLTSAWALSGAVVVEYLGAVEGMGYLLGQGQRTNRVDAVLGAIIVVAFVALTIDRVIVHLERRFTRWRLT